MAPKRAAAAAAAKPESSTSGSDDESGSGSSYSSPEEEEPQRKEEVRPPLPSHKKNPVVPPVPSSDEEEEDGSEEEEEGDGSEEEDEDDSGDEDPKSGALQTTKGPPPPPQETLPKPTSDESSEGSDSDSESSDESPPSVPAPRPSRAAEPSIKPITTKPMDGPSNPVNQVSSSPSSLDQGSVKRKRESVGSPQPGQKRQSFQRVWGLDDELILLNGLAEFRSKKGYAPSTNPEMEVVRELIKDSFRLVVSDNQLLDKVRRLKKKFQTNAARAKNGVDPVLSNAHEQESYAISKKVWGSEKSTYVNGNGNGNASANSESEGNEEERGNEISQKSKDEANYPENGGNVKAHFPFLWETANKIADELPCGVGIKMALDMLDNAKAKALEDKLEKLIMSKTRMHMRRINLSKETVKLLLDSVAKSD